MADIRVTVLDSLDGSEIDAKKYRHGVTAGNLLSTLAHEFFRGGLKDSLDFDIEFSDAVLAPGAYRYIRAKVVPAAAGQGYGLPEDQAKLITELAAFLLQEEKRKKSIRISSVSQTAWMDLQQKARLNLVYPSEAEMVPTHSSDLPAFGWDDRMKNAQYDRYIPHLNKIRTSRTWSVIDAVNKYPTLLSCDISDRHFTGTTDVAWVERRSVPLLPQTGLQCIFELKKDISSAGAGQYQALISLLCANVHSSYKPFVVLTDLVDWWALYWVDGSSIYQHFFDSRATAVGYIEDLLVR